jgi:hypothetical protein
MSISAMKQALEALEKLWDIIDDIDTYGDMAKSDDKLYRSLVERRQRQRFEQTGISTDGYELNGGAITALRQAIAEAERHVSYVCPNCHWSLEKQVRTHTLEDVKKIESKWSGLTEDDLASCKSDEFVVFAKTIEAKLKEKNNGN